MSLCKTDKNNNNNKNDITFRGKHFKWVIEMFVLNREHIDVSNTLTSSDLKQRNSLQMVCYSATKVLQYNYEYMSTCISKG